MIGRGRVGMRGQIQGRSGYSRSNLVNPSSVAVRVAGDSQEGRRRLLAGAAGSVWATHRARRVAGTWARCNMNSPFFLSVYKAHKSDRFAERCCW